MRNKATVITYGCQMNKRDSEILSGLLAEMGYELTKDLEDSDLILINTCCVRENADKRIYGRIGSLKRLKDKNSELIMGVCGCLAQKDKEFMARRAPHIDLVLGTFGFSQLPHLIEKIKRDRQQIVACWDKEEGEPLESISRREDDLKAWVSIVYGCNNFCSYCIVPYVRGRERSRPQKAIIREVEELADKGYKEITLLGQNVNSYRRDLEGKPAFADLLYSLNEIEGVERFRFTTAHPRDVPDKLIYAMRDLPKVCEHFHLPLQSGSDPILKAMNRGYTTSYYRELVDRIRKEIPDVGLTTDLIVGFPGETEEQFEESLEFIRQIEFDSAFTFAYSPRSGTAAAAMEDSVPPEVKRERLHKLIEMQNEISYKVNQRRVGTVVEIMVEGVSEKNPNRLMGLSRENKVVLFPAKRRIESGNWRSGKLPARGDIVKIKVAEARAWTLYGDIAS